MQLPRTAALLACVAAPSGCADGTPYLLRIHAATASECDEYEPLLEDAIDFWAGHGIDAFDQGECQLDEFERDPTVSWPADETIAHTDDLAAASDDVPVFVVDSITVDEAGVISHPRGATVVSEVVGCPRLVAIDLPRAQLLAHELGHLLWLDHVDESGNVMHPSSWPDDIADLLVGNDQLDDARSNYDLCQKKQH